MQHAIDKQNKRVSEKTVTQVAVAVIHYQSEYLLGFRESSQHQGNRYEFVGGKIESYESPSSALIREVKEEVDIDIEHNVIIKLGRLYHDYGDKQVALHVYQVALTVEQYEDNKKRDLGSEGQAITWVTKEKLLAGLYPLPAANKPILTWLQLPQNIVITYPLAQFKGGENVSKEASSYIENLWLDYHTSRIPKGAWTYLRIKSDESLPKANGIKPSTVLQQLMQSRLDMKTIVPYTLYDAVESENVVALHVTHNQLMDYFASISINAAAKFDSNGNSLLDIFSRLNMPLILSCHNEDSINAANVLADLLIKNQLTPVMGIFLSPVLSTKSHADAMPLGWERWSELANIANMPVIALGGLSPRHLEQTMAFGGTSVSGIRNFLEVSS